MSVGVSFTEDIGERVAGRPAALGEEFFHQRAGKGAD
jgi:hypothetical protein